MSTVSIDFSKPIGRIKPMHAVNNGPVQSVFSGGNFELYRDARIPYARNHDASFCATYGGEHIVDVHMIFPDFSKDPEDPASYDFDLTDDYVQITLDAGTQVFYRLGTKIEHARKKYGTIMPPDFQKWAVICEHIIRHYNEGWANGFHHNIVYWEIWNEADGVKSNGDKPNWSGTDEQFFEFYATAAKHLKACFPQLKIGGPAVSWIPNGGWGDRFLAYQKERNVPIDFFSWHIYNVDPGVYVESAELGRRMLDQAGYPDTETILDEWNYLIDFEENFIRSVENMIRMHGAACVASVMLACQASPLDMLMYYDARPCVFNGLFDFYTYRPLKGYYPFPMFSELYELENSVAVSSDDKNVYVAAAANGERRAVMLSYYCDHVQLEAQTVQIHLEDGTYRVKLLDETRTMEESVHTTEDGTFSLFLQPDSVVLITKA